MRVRIEQQIGTGGVFQDSAYIEVMLAGYDYAGRKPTGEKSDDGGVGSRCRPKAATSGWPRAPGMMSLCASCASLPGRHDDQADAAAGARSMRLRPATPCKRIWMRGVVA